MGAIVQLLLSALLIAGMWKTFEKAGQPGWASIVPFYNFYILVTEILGKPINWFIMCLIPIVNIFYLYKISVALAESFGKDKGFGLGIFFLPMIFYPMIGFNEEIVYTAPVKVEA